METLWVDVGGTTTRIVLADENNRPLKSLSSPSNLFKLKNQIQNAIRVGGRRPQKLLVGIRGVWNPVERGDWKKQLASLSRETEVMSDIELAHRWMFHEREGILLNAGTGSIAFARRKNKTARAGGLGPLLGDEGSGFWIGRAYLRLLYRKKHDLDLIRSYATSPGVVPKVASLAKMVLESRSPESKQIVEQAQMHLSALLDDVIAQLNWRGYVPIKLVGGLFKNNNFTKSMIRRMEKRRVSKNL